MDETSTETPKETPVTETATTPTKEKKGGLLGFIKKEAARLEGKKDLKKEDVAEKKEEKPIESASNEPVAAAVPTEAPATTDGAAAPMTEEARPTDKRRSSLFGNLGITKRTANNDSTDAEAADAGTKREKSPLPQRIGSLFRRPSRPVKSEQAKEVTAADTEATPAAEATPAPISKDETAMTNGLSSTENPGSAMAGDNMPENVHATIHDAVTTVPEVEASA